MDMTSRMERVRSSVLYAYLEDPIALALVQGQLRSGMGARVKQ